MSNPIAATYGRRSSTSLKVPWRPGSLEHDRGNSSYHVLNRALSGSTTTGNSIPYLVTRVRSGYRSARGPSPSSIAAVAHSGTPRVSTGRIARAKIRSFLRSTPLARFAASSARTAPTRRSTEISWPASIFLERFRCQERNRATQA